MLKKLCAVAVLSLIFFPTIFSMEQDEDNRASNGERKSYSQYTSEDIVISHNNRRDSDQLVPTRIFGQEFQETPDSSSEVDASVGTSDAFRVDKGKEIIDEEDVIKEDDVEVFKAYVRQRMCFDQELPVDEGNYVKFVRPRTLRPKDWSEKVEASKNGFLICGICLGTVCACVHKKGLISSSIAKWGYVASALLIGGGVYKAYNDCQKQVWQSDENYISSLRADLENPKFVYLASKYFGFGEQEIPIDSDPVNLYILTSILKLMMNGTLVTSVPDGDDKVTLYTNPNSNGMKITNFAILIKSIIHCNELNCTASGNLGFTSERNVPDALFIFRNLTKITITKVSFIEPAAIFTLPHLNRLEIRDCHSGVVSALMQSLEKYESSPLQEVILPNNKLNSTQVSLGSLYKLSNVTELDLSDNRLDKVPQNITYLTNLNKLDLSRNNLESISPTFTCLQNMQAWSLRGNNRLRREDIPAGIRGQITFGD